MVVQDAGVVIVLCCRKCNCDVFKLDMMIKVALLVCASLGAFCVQAEGKCVL